MAIVPRMFTVLMGNTKSSSKNVWRAKMLQSRLQLGPEKTSQLNREICKNLSFVWAMGGSLEKNDASPLWFAYKSFRWEADPQQAVIDSSPYIRWAFPRITSDSQMEFFIPDATNSLWSKNSWGLWEPDPRTATPALIQTCVGVLVPGVAFDRQGQRLGYGKGFYDRALTGFKGLKIGVAFSVQLSSEPLPSDDSDIKMDLIVTEKEIIKLGEARH